MWKATLLSLAVVLGTVQGTYRNGLGVSSWDNMLAELMDHHMNVETGACTPDKCYVSSDGTNRLMDVGETFVLPDKPCVQYTCERTGVIANDIECAEVDCNNGAPVTYPGQCCPVCEGQPNPPIEFGPWTEWTECSRSCGGGKQARVRECKIPPGSDIVECTGILREVQECNALPCPVNCTWEWGEYEACTKTCNGGTRSRYPIITQHALHGGEPCPPDVRNNVPQTMMCINDPCPVDCRWLDWKEWSMCTKTCNGGTRTRTREKVDETHGGKPCVGPSSETEDCNTNPCPVHCVWEQWGRWSTCSATCDGGTRTRSRGKIVEKHGGNPCVGSSTQTEECNPNPCPVDCKWGAWNKWSACTRTCDGGRRTRTREVLVEKAYGGEDCVGSSRETEDCNTDPCPEDCEFTWGEFTECSEPCDGGTKSRSPIIIQHPQHGGRACPDKEIMVCNDFACPLCEPGYHKCKGMAECIPDKDKDCIEDQKDNCVAEANPKQEDEDKDGVGDACDNCIYAKNPGQENNDGDTDGNACDPDDDNDGIVDTGDRCAETYNPDNRDRDGDGIGDCCDDCTWKYDDQFIAQRCHTPLELYKIDTDSDGLPDSCDNCPNHYNPQQTVDSNGNLPCQRELSYAQEAYNDDKPSASDYDNDKKGLTAQIMEKLLEMYYSN